MEAAYRTCKLLSGLILGSTVFFASACSFQGGISPGAGTIAPVQGETTGVPPDKPEQEPGVTSQGDDRCDNTQFDPVSDLEIRPVPPLHEPVPRESYVDPVFGTCVVRVTDRASDLVEGDPSRGMKNEYSRVQSFNADGSRLIVFTTEGNWYLYAAASLLPLEQLPVSHEPRWDAEDPDLLYFTEDTRLMSYRLSSRQVTVVHEFADDFPGQDIAAVWTKYEGSPSIDSRYWGLMAEDQDWMTVAMLVYDLEADQVIARRAVPPSEIDSVTISPLANYFLAYHDDPCEQGQLGSEAHPCGLMVYDKNLENGRGLLRVVGHSDPVLDAGMAEVLVYQDIDTDQISMLDLASGAITPLWPIDFSSSALGFHFSGSASRAPGWVLVSTYNGSQPSATWMDDQVFAVELVEGGRVVRLAHTHAVVDEQVEHDYWAEPHASVNQDFTQVVFTSNWGRSGTGEIDMYMIRLPGGWLTQLP